MEKSVSKAMLVSSLFVMGIVIGAEGGRDMPVPKTYDQVFQQSQPQGSWGFIWPIFPLPSLLWPPGFGGNTPPFGLKPFGFGGIPGLGPLNIPTFEFPPPPPSAPKFGIGGPP